LSDPDSSNDKLRSRKESGVADPAALQTHDREAAADVSVDEAQGQIGSEPTSKEIFSAISGLKESIEKAAAEISQAAAKREPASTKSASSTWDRFWEVTKSGLFFMIVGCVFLLLAFLSMGGPTYSIFSFVLVVLAVGILLFGTGTQSMGELASNPNAPAYKIGIAGGAGVIAFCVAYGIVKYSPDMKNAFQIEKKYMLVKVEPQGDGTSTFDNYAPEFTMDGVSIPTMRRGRFVMIYVPYLESENTGGKGEISLKKITAEFYVIEPSARNPLLNTRVTKDFGIEIRRDNILTNDAGFDFPVYCKREANKDCSRIEIDMRSKDSAQVQLDKSSTNRGSQRRDDSGNDQVPAAKLPSAADL
jgi:hypothetical protein